MKTKISDIEAIEIFKGIAPSSIIEIKNNSDVIELKKNKALYSDRQILSYVYFLVSGNVSLVKSNENGESKIIFLLSSGAMINQPMMRKNTSAVECWGYENSKILRVSFENFDRILSKDYALTKNCMFYMEKRIRRLYRQLKNSVTANIDKKLVAKLYRLAIEHGLNDGYKENFTLINLNLTITYIAKMLGSQRETISRTIKSLANKEILFTENKKIYIDMEKAKNFFKN